MQKPIERVRGGLFLARFTVVLVDMERKPCDCFGEDADAG